MYQLLRTLSECRRLLARHHRRIGERVAKSSEVRESFPESSMTSCAAVDIVGPYRAAFFTLEEGIVRSVGAATQCYFCKNRLSYLLQTIG